MIPRHVRNAASWAIKSTVVWPLADLHRIGGHHNHCQKQMPGHLSFLHQTSVNNSRSTQHHHPPSPSHHSLSTHHLLQINSPLPTHHCNTPLPPSENPRTMAITEADGPVTATQSPQNPPTLHSHDETASLRRLYEDGVSSDEFVEILARLHSSPERDEAL